MSLHLVRKTDGNEEEKIKSANQTLWIESVNDRANERVTDGLGEIYEI